MPFGDSEADADPEHMHAVHEAGMLAAAYIAHHLREDLPAMRGVLELGTGTQERAEGFAMGLAQLAIAYAGRPAISEAEFAAQCEHIAGQFAQFDAAGPPADY